MPKPTKKLYRDDAVAFVAAQSYDANLKYALTSPSASDKLNVARRMLENLEILAGYGKNGKKYEDQVLSLEEQRKSIISANTEDEPDTYKVNKLIADISYAAERTREEHMQQVVHNHSRKAMYAGIVGGIVIGSSLSVLGQKFNDKCDAQEAPSVQPAKTAPAAESSARHPVLDQFGIG